MDNREFHRFYTELCIIIAIGLVCWTWGFFTHVSWCRVHHTATDKYHRSASEAVRR